MKDAKAGIDAAGKALREHLIDQRSHWSARTASFRAGRSSAHLLPNYDEYLVAYADRDAVVLPHRRGISGPRASEVLANPVVIDGVVIGTWTKSLRPGGVRVTVIPHLRLTPAGGRAVAAAADRFGKFLGLPVDLSVNA
jgi:hypothetical protein